MKKFENPRITMLFLCYNDSGTIANLVQTSSALLRKLRLSYEIVVVDDGSEDHSLQILRAIQTRITNLRIVEHQKNRGYGAALATGFAYATGELVFYTDGDGQYDVLEFPVMLTGMTQDIDFVNGMKIQRSDPWYRTILGNGYNMVVRSLFWLPVFDTDCDYRLIRKHVLTKIPLTCRSGAVCVELVKKAHMAGARIRQVSVHHYPRKYGTSQFFRPLRLLQTFQELCVLWIHTVILGRYM